MEKRHGSWRHPFLCEQRAGDREIRMRPGKSLPVVRGKE